MFSPGFCFNYVEIHHRLKAGFTLLSRTAPEILFDAPLRIDAGKPLPAMLLIRHADRFPIEIKNITAAIGLLDKHRIFMHEFQPDIANLNSPLYSQIFQIPLPDDYTGQVRLNFKLTYAYKGREEIVLNDNIPFTSKLDYGVLVSPDPLPHVPGWIFGEPHFHSDLTCDEVEYGVPLELVPPLASAQGLRFAFSMDHSYDLDPRNPFGRPDAFARLRERAHLLNTPDFILVPGEEVSARTRTNRTVHVGVVNADRFFEGYGDCGRTLQTLCAHSVEELAAAFKRSGSALVFAAHPGFQESFLERVLLNRGGWDKRKDYPEGMQATQFWNGPQDSAFKRGKRDWISLLLGGKRIYAIGGNDAHGDFNRTRKIGFPFLTIKEDVSHRFGFVRTAVKPEVFSTEGLLTAVRKGRVMMTNGPFAELKVATAESGDTFRANGGILRLEALSSAEFGPIKSMTLYQGILGGREERIGCFPPEKGSLFKSIIEKEVIIKKPGYLRAEVSSQNNKNVFSAYTNPVWLEPDNPGVA